MIISWQTKVQYVQPINIKFISIHKETSPPFNISFLQNHKKIYILSNSVCEFHNVFDKKSKKDHVVHLSFYVKTVFVKNFSWHVTDSESVLYSQCLGPSWLRHCAVWIFVCVMGFSLTWYFRPPWGAVVDSTSNRNEYQEYFLRGKGGRCLRLTN
jgi:hypothetical protein